MKSSGTQGARKEPKTGNNNKENSILRPNIIPWTLVIWNLANQDVWRSVDNSKNISVYLLPPFHAES